MTLERIRKGRLNVVSTNPQFAEYHENAEAMKGVDFLVHREDLIAAARRNHAPDKVVKDLQRLADQSYSNVTEVMHALGHHSG